MQPQTQRTDTSTSSRRRSRRQRKRARPTSQDTNTKPKATLIATSLLWLVAVTTHPSPSAVSAFVLPTIQGPTAAPYNAGFSRSTEDRVLSSTSRFSSTLAEVEARPSTKLDDLLQGKPEERPEDVLNMANLPLLLLPDHHHHQQHDIKDGTSSSSSSSSSAQGILSQISIPDEEEVLEWAERYTSVEALREHFGTNHNKLWGDLQASTARRLYKTLLPRALLELSKLGKVQPQDLAPLAYQARLAAKLYARERCTVPARIAATLFDGFRQWIKYGKFQGHGMTYDQLWEKYADKILQETEQEQHNLLHHHHHACPDGIDAFHHHGHHEEEEDDDDEECDPFHSDCEDLSELVCRKILERACVSNEAVDSLALQGQDLADETELQPDQRLLLEKIRSQLEQDMYQLLMPPPPPARATVDDDDTTTATMPELHNTHGNKKRDRRLKRGKFRLVKTIAKQRRFWRLLKAQRDIAKLSRAGSSEGDDDDTDYEDDQPWRKSRPKPWLSRNRQSRNRRSGEQSFLSDSDDDAEETSVTSVVEMEQDHWKP